jgi:hypothetical protein
VVPELHRRPDWDGRRAPTEGEERQYAAMSDGNYFSEAGFLLHDFVYM